jgi:hypothetical protein
MSCDVAGSRYVAYCLPFGADSVIASIFQSSMSHSGSAHNAELANASATTGTRRGENLQPDAGCRVRASEISLQGELVELADDIAIRRAWLCSVGVWCQGLQGERDLAQALCKEPSDLPVRGHVEDAHADVGTPAGNQDVLLCVKKVAAHALPHFRPPLILLSEAS